MPAASAQRNVQRMVHRVLAQAPPVRGLNTTGAAADMPPSDALEMDNFISNDLGVELRGGWREYATGLGHPVRTVMSYDGAPVNAMVSPISQSVLFAATDWGIYDIEGGGDFAGASPMIGLSQAFGAGRFSLVSFTTAGGKYLVACSETDGAFLFDGTVWMKMVLGGTAGPGHITGCDPALFVQVCVWKERLLFVERTSTRVWILPVGQVGGAVVVFDFGRMFRFGGALVGIVNWTQDAGQGIDDHLVVIGSSGDLLVYAGTDPTAADKFAVRGVWFIGQPVVGRRCFTTAGGNVFVLTVFGVVPVAQVVQGGLDTLQLTGTEYFQQLQKIQGALHDDFETLANSLGWEVMYLPNKALLIVSRPQVIQNEWVQYAFQEHNMAWSRLLDIPGTTFARRLGEAYAGTEDGRVLRILDGATDGMKLDGSGAYEVRGRVTPAFSYFGDPVAVKQALMSRVNFLSNADPGYIIKMNTDFSVQAPGQAPTPGHLVGSLWNQAMWNQDFWIGGKQAFGQWRSVEGMGFALSPTIYVASEQPCTIANIEHMVKAGGPL